MKTRESIKSVLIIALTLFSLSSCKDKPIGYGVLLWWDEDTAFTEGATYPVFSESSIRNTFILSTPDSSVVEVPRWRMNLFSEEEAALEFKEYYDPLIRIYGEAQKNGLAIRTDADPDSERIYKLREGQLVKIVEKMGELLKIGSTEGYWYRVLTEDGTAGYCFGANLDIFDMDVRSAQTDSMEIDPILDDFLSVPFRPEEFRKMVLEKRIDLERFSTAIGCFPNLEERKITIVTPEEVFEFEFDKILMGNPGHFIFGESGLDIKVINPNRVVLHYDNKGASIDELYVVVSGMNELIQAEKERQDAIFEDFFYMGPTQSNAYGTIVFEGMRHFVWEGNEKLIPDIIPRGLDNRGEAEIIYFPVAEIKNSYDGVLSLNFTPASTESSLHFLFNRLDNGLRLTHVPARDIKDGLVQRVNPSPLIMFFTSDNPRPRPEGDS